MQVPEYKKILGKVVGRRFGVCYNNELVLTKVIKQHKGYIQATLHCNTANKDILFNTRLKTSKTAFVV